MNASRDADAFPTTAFEATDEENLVGIYTQFAARRESILTSSTFQAASNPRLPRLYIIRPNFLVGGKRSHRVIDDRQVIIIISLRYLQRILLPFPVLLHQPTHPNSSFRRIAPSHLHFPQQYNKTKKRDTKNGTFTDRGAFPVP